MNDWWGADIDAIRDRWSGGFYDDSEPTSPVHDIRLLLAEVRRLQDALREFEDEYPEQVRQLLALNTGEDVMA